MSFERLFERICDTKFWDHDLCWATGKPTLTPCFVDTALVWPPIIFLWINFPYAIYMYLNSDRPEIPYNRNNVIKLILAIIMTIVELVHAIHMLIYWKYGNQQQNNYVTPAHLLALWLTVSSHLLMLLYFHLQRKKGFVNGGVIWFYLLVTFFFNIITILVTLNRPFKHRIYLLIKLILQAVLFIICSHADQNPYEKCKESKIPCPLDSASIPSRLLFWWFNSLVRLGYRRPLTIDDLWSMRKHNSSKHLMRSFKKFSNHNIEHQKDFPSNINNETIKKKLHKNLWKILVQMFWPYFLFPTIGRLCTDLLQLANPIVLKLLINYTISSDVEIWHGILYSLTFFLINLIQSWSSIYQQHRFSVLALRIRSTLIGAIYRKSLVLANYARKDYSTGDIVNLMAVDSQRFIDLVRFINYLWTTPILIIIGFYLLWQEMKESVTGGFILMFLMIPIQALVTRRIKSIQVKQMMMKDQRLGAISELLSGMKVIKLYAWEEAFIQNIRKIRIVELAFIRLSGLITAIYVTITVCSPFLITFSVFAIYTKVFGLKLTSEKAFVTISLFNMLRVPLAALPNMLTTLILTIVSMKRISGFLNADEIEHYIKRKPMKNIAIQISNASFSWNNQNDSNDLELTNINVKIPKGRLVAVVGQVGSGKSSFLYALMGEMNKYCGSVKINEELKMAYVAQKPWIQNLTARDNILFGLPYDHKKYTKVIQVCALKSDFEMLSGGDLTEIGEKGMNLSGGQKQRISIARACYSDADLYLFDDPLSAVDSHVGKHLFEEVFSTNQGLLSGKTRILVTNALYILPMVDEVILLKNGTIEAMGSCQQLLKQNKYFRELIDNYHQTHSSEEYYNKKTNAKDLENIDGNHLINHYHQKVHKNESHHRPLHRQITSESLFSDSESLSSVSTFDSYKEVFDDDERIKKMKKNDGKLVETESIETGQISWSVYKKFIVSLKFWFYLIITGYFCATVSSSGANFWLSFWTDKIDKNNSDDGYELWIYFSIGIMQLVFIALGWISIVFGCLRSSRTLHERLMASIVQAPMYFFDTTPSGRIMNRFSRDIDLLDTTMPFFMRIYMIHPMNVLATLFIICIETHPIFLLFIFPFIVLYILIQRFYIATSRQLKRIESISRSPIYTHFYETLNGVSTIKAYDACQRFIEENNVRVDHNFRCYYPSRVADCWLTVRLELLANLLIFFSSLIATLTKLIDKDGIGLSGSQIGLSLSYALNITLSLNWCVQVSAEFENNIVSVERICEYINVKPEAAWNTKNDSNLPDKWPSKGQITMDNYATRYRPGLDLVLKNMNLSIKPGEKIGIVGRTGAGKSSLTLGLFRLIEAAQGKISIDDVDISLLGLHKLRSCLTIIPQDPFLFYGTIRYNLDPFNNYTDDQLWTVLELSHLKSFVLSLESGLEYKVSESGENLSVGQKQLFCLARALLRQTNVLILDEATAAVDFETDSLIQSTIRKEFAHCTILTIAHRLNTIMDSDRVLVLDAGQVAEFDTPKTLLSDRSSIFFTLAKDSGATHHTFGIKNIQKSK